VSAAPLLPLVLLAAESHLRRASRGRAVGLAAALAVLLLAGSPEAARAGLALVVARLALGHLAPAAGGPRLLESVLAVAGGIALAAPQLVPTLLALPEAGRQATGFVPHPAPPLPGLAGLVLRYVSHTPAPALAAAALALVPTEAAVRALVGVLTLGLVLQWGQGPMAAPGSLPLLFDFALAALAGLSLSAQWRQRGDSRGRRLRLHFLAAALVSAAALSISAATLGPLRESLSGAVGVLAIALILYFTLAEDPDPVKRGVWLLPLSVSLLLQPHGRGAWDGAPGRAALEQGTATRAAIDRMLGPRRAERILTLTTRWPEEALDLEFPSLGALSPRRSANGYDPMVPLRNRAALDGMSPAGSLPRGFLRSDPRRLELLGVRFLQVPASALTGPVGPAGLGDVLDLPLEPQHPRFFPLPIVPCTEVRLGSWMADAVTVRDGEPVARVVVRLATGRELPLELRAGRDTAEWAHDRADVRGVVAHGRPPVFESFRAAGFEGHRYLATLSLNGRFWVDGLRIERLPGRGHLFLARLGLADGTTGRLTPVGAAAAYASDLAVLREVAATPAVRLFELPGSPSGAHVAGRLRVLDDEGAVLAALAAPRRAGIDPLGEALVTRGALGERSLPAGSRAGAARVRRLGNRRLEVRAEGPGLLVVAESWDRGWSAEVDGQPAPVVRVNHAQLGIVLGAGTRRVLLQYFPEGLAAGLGIAAVCLVGAGLALRRRGRDV
ncbi:MAG: YfhO family protein, partial [Solirubrobacteraceae bacterium]|nr:YfhO family protein [Solirubrobacteraceae bacterium]